MATQIPSLPESLTIPEDMLHRLQDLADSQSITMSEALTQAIEVSDIVVRSINAPNSKVLLKNGNKYQQLTLVRDAN